MKERLKYGVALNDASYHVSKVVLEGGRKVKKICPYYSKWSSMLHRCYSKNYHKKKPTYTACVVCEEWLLFSNFKRWMESQEWEGRDLDKDLLFKGNKVYSPETCIFIPKAVNSFLTKCNGSRGDYPLGVTRRKRVHVEAYIAQISSVLHSNLKMKFLGVFYNTHDAHRAWQLAKISSAKALKTAYPEDEKVQKGLDRVVECIEFDIASGKITETF